MEACWWKEGGGGWGGKGRCLEVSLRGARERFKRGEIGELACVHGPSVALHFWFLTPLEAWCRLEVKALRWYNIFCLVLSLNKRRLLCNFGGVNFISPNSSRLLFSKTSYYLGQFLRWKSSANVKSCFCLNLGSEQYGIDWHAGNAFRLIFWIHVMQQVVDPLAILFCLLIRFDLRSDLG